MMLLKSAKSIYKGSHEVTSLYLGGNLIWTKPTAEEGNWFIGVTKDGNPYNVRINSQQHSVNSGEKYHIEEPLTTTYNMFYGCYALTSLDVTHLDTSKVTRTQNMFYECNALTSLDLSNWDTSNVTNMGYMFTGCNALTSLDLSNWDTSNVTTMGSMFNGCNGLTSLDLSNWDTSNVTNMGYMFANCKDLTSLDVSHFDTANVTNMGYMFFNLVSLTSLDVSHFDTANVTTMGGMFYNCSALTTVTGPITGIGASIDLSYSPLTHDSAMVFINGLATVSSTQTLTFKSTTYDTLTPEEIALATSKGWSVARS